MKQEEHTTKLKVRARTYGIETNRITKHVCPPGVSNRTSTEFLRVGRKVEKMNKNEYIPGN